MFKLNDIKRDKDKQAILIIFGLSVFLFFLKNPLPISIKDSPALAANTFNRDEKKEVLVEEKYLPIARPDFDQEKINALAYSAAFMNKKGEFTILAEKNPNDLLPMASITKLMTALVAYQNYDQEDILTMPKKIDEWDDSSRRFIVGTAFKIKDLLHALLIESNNDAAMVLASKIGEEKFLKKMNQEAARLNIITTYYDNPTGLDPYSSSEFIGHSTANDLLKLLREIIINYPDILRTTALSDYDIKTAGGTFNHKAISTNKFIADKITIPFCQDKTIKIFGGKTGTTDMAKKNLVMVSEIPGIDGYLLTIILSAKDNFTETNNLIEWVCQAYLW